MNKYWIWFSKLNKIGVKLSAIKAKVGTKNALDLVQKRKRIY